MVFSFPTLQVEGVEPVLFCIKRNPEILNPTLVTDSIWQKGYTRKNIRMAISDKIPQLMQKMRRVSNILKDWNTIFLQMRL